MRVADKYLLFKCVCVRARVYKRKEREQGLVNLLNNISTTHIDRKVCVRLCDSQDNQ